MAKTQRKAPRGRGDNRGVRQKKRGPGKPKKVVTTKQWRRIGEYALNGCQNGTIATLMGWDKQFIEGRDDILTFLQEKRAERKYRLRSAQTRNATKHKSHTMQIFLGVNELGQRDTKQIDATQNFAKLLHEAMKSDGSDDAGT